MNNLLRSLPLALLALASSLPSHALTEAEAEAGRALLKRYADTVVGVELVVTIKGTTQTGQAIPPREQKLEINGTIIAPTGLTVISLGDIDPRSRLPNMRLDDPDYKEVKLRRADGTEIPAQVVLKDADLDLAFVAPTNASEEQRYPYVNLDEAAESVVLGTYYDVARVPKLQQRTPVVRPIHVVGMIEKPRRFILATNYAINCPVFDAQGKVLGIAVRHIAGNQQTGLVILPAEDVAEIARQAAAVKPEDIAPTTAADAAPAEATP